MKKLLPFLLALLVATTASAQTVGQPIVTAARPTALQLLQASAGGSTWAPVTIGGDALAGASPGLFKITGLQGTPVSATAPTQYQVLAGAYGGGSWTPITFSGDMTWTGTGTPSTRVGTAGGGCFTFGTGGVLTLGTVSGGPCGTTQSIVLPGTSSAMGLGLSISAGSTTGATGGALMLAPGASSATNGTPGNVVLALPAPTGTGTNAYVQQKDGTNVPMAFGAYPGTRRKA